LALDPFATTCWPLWSRSRSSRLSP
jgi:hypothetical protein